MLCLASGQGLLTYLRCEGVMEIDVSARHLSWMTVPAEMAKLAEETSTRRACQCQLGRQQRLLIVL